MKQHILIISCAFLFAVHCAPVEIKEESKRRETTKETLELENALKRLAGENKQYFTGNHARPIPQIDGLEDHHGRPVQKPQHKPVTEDIEKLVHAQQRESDEDINKELPEQLDKLQQELHAENEIKNVEEEEDNNVPEDSQQSDDMNNDVDKDDIPAGDESVPNNEPVYYPDQNLANNYAMYRDYPYSGSMADIDGQQNEDYVLQDVLAMMEQHPKLWNRIIQAKNSLNEEVKEENEADQEEEGHQSIDGMEPNLENLQQLANKYYQASELSQPESLYDREDEEALQKMKAFEQYEKLQELYGDADAHVVAKKKGYGPVHYMYEQEEGSGEQVESKMTDEQGDQSEQPEHNDNTVVGEDKPVFKMPMM